MDKGLLSFLNGEKNVIQIDVIIGKEKTEKGMEYITISLTDGQKLYGFWHNPKKKFVDKPPKHTGGKKSYVMVMLKKARELVKNGMSIEYMGYVVGLCDNIAWNTGIVCNKRTKKPLEFKDILKLWKVNDKKGRQIIKELQKYNLLIKTEEGYKVSPDFIKKGGAKK